MQSPKDTYGDSGEDISGIKEGEGGDVWGKIGEIGEGVEEMMGLMEQMASGGREISELVRAQNSILYLPSRGRN